MLEDGSKRLISVTPRHAKSPKADFLSPRYPPHGGESVVWVGEGVINPPQYCSYGHTNSPGTPLPSAKGEGNPASALEGHGGASGLQSCTCGMMNASFSLGLSAFCMGAKTHVRAL